MLNGLTIALGLGAGWAAVRALRGRAAAWFVAPMLGLLLSLGAWALAGRIGVFEAWVPFAALGLISAAGGAGLGSAAHSDWNTRRRVGLSVVILALSVEGALLLGWLGMKHSANASPSFVLLFSGLALALVSFRQGVLPEEVRWGAGLRVSVALSVVAGMGLWWWHSELEAERAGSLSSLSGDLVANVSHQGAWGLWGVAGVAGVLLLGASTQPWVRRFGAGLALGIGLLLPLPSLGMRYAVDQSCAEHLPEEPGLFDAIPDDPPIEIPQGWCRAPMAPSLECPRTPTLYQQSTTGRAWAARRIEADPLDTLWRQRWSRPGSIRGQALRVSRGDPHLGDWLVSGGNREPEDLDGTLEVLVDDLAACRLSEDPAPAMVVDLVIAQSGVVRSARVQAASSYTQREQDCVVNLARRLEFPYSTCDGDQRLMVPLFAGYEAD